MQQETFARAEHVAFVALQRYGQLGDELFLGHREAPRGERLGPQTPHLRFDQLDALLRVAVVATEVGRHDTAVGVGGVGGFDVVGEPVFFTHDDVEERVGRRTAQYVHQQRQRQTAGIVDPAGAAADDAVGLVGVLRDGPLERRPHVGRCPVRRPHRGGLPSEIAVGDGFDGLGRDVADRRENHLIGRMRAGREAADGVPVETGERLFAAEDVVSQFGTFEEHVLEGVVDEVGGRIFVGVDLVADHLLFAFQLPVRKGRAEGDVGDQFGRLGEIAAQRRGMDGGVLLGGEGVEFAAEVFQPAVDLPCPAALGAFEKGMLGEVREAVFRGQLVARTGVDDQRAMSHVAPHAAVYAPNAVREAVGCEFVHR